MKTKAQIKAMISAVESNYRHVLTGSIATVQVNAPRALMQVEAETKLAMLHWVIKKKYYSKLKGVNR